MTMAGMRRRGYVENHPAKDEFWNGEEMKTTLSGDYKYEVNPKDGCNVSDEIILEQVEANIRRQLPQVQPHAPNHETIALVCGGPSLAAHEKELVEAVWRGAKVVAVNGAYAWCVEHNIKPTAMVMLDAREFNTRFLETPVPGCRYLLASQCHPRAFELCADRDVTIWHCCSGGEPEQAVLLDYYFGRVFPIGLGTTVAIKSIQLMRMLGFQSFDIFGFDSCWYKLPTTLELYQHHAYDQKENDNDKRLKVVLKPEGRDDMVREFMCAPWMMRQSMDFQKLIHDHGNDFRLNIRGDGLIATIMKFSAELGSEVIASVTEE